MKSYTLKVLNNEEFDRLPYKYARESLGCADTKTKTAYIRNTGINALDTFVTAHEIEELVNKHSEHEYEGIRYKKGKDIFKIVGPAILGIATGGLGLAPMWGALAGAGLGGGLAGGKPKNWLPAAAMGGLGGYGGASLGKGFAAGFNAPGATASTATMGDVLVKPTLGQQLMGGFKGALGLGGVGNVGGKVPTTPTTPYTPQDIHTGGGLGFDLTKPTIGGIAPSETGYASTMKSTAPFGQYGNPSNMAGYNPIPASTGAGAMKAASNTLKGISPVTSSMFGFSMGNSMKPNAGLGGTTPAAPNQLTQQFGATQGTGLDQAAQTGKRTGLWEKLFPKEGYSWGQTMAGSAIPLIGDAFSPKVQRFSPEQSNIFNDLLQRVKQGTQVQLSPEQRSAITANYDSELEDAREEIIKRWKGVRPGSDITNDSELRQAITEMESEYAREKANALTSAQLNLTGEQNQMLSQLASMDIYSLAQTAQISLEEANQFKQMLADLGATVSTSGNNSSLSMLQRMFA